MAPRLWTLRRFIQKPGAKFDAANQLHPLLTESPEHISDTQSRLAAIVESSDDAIISKDLTGIITSWNKAAERMYGYRAEEVIGQPVAILVPPDQADDITTILTKIKHGERIDHYETKRRAKDGTILDVSLTVSPIYDSTGRLVGASKIARDISARKRMERLQQFLDQASELLMNSFDYETMLRDLARHCVPIMADWCSVHVLQDERKLFTVDFVADSPDLLAALSQLRENYPFDPEGTYGVAYVLRTGTALFLPEIDESVREAHAKDAEQLPLIRKLQVRSSLLVPMQARGQVLGVISLNRLDFFRQVLGRNIVRQVLGVISLNRLDSGRHYLPEDFLCARYLAQRAGLAIDNVRLYRQALDASKVRDEFLSIAAHELKTPLTGLRGMTQLLLRQIGKNGKLDPAKFESHLRIIDNQAVKLNSLLSQLLDVSRLEAGRLSLEPGMTNIATLVTDVIETIKRTTTRTIILTVPPALEAVIDPLRMEQVIVNLVDNALKYSPDGTAVEVEVSTPTPGQFRLAVSDHGSPIPAELHQLIFDRFYQARATDTQGGLGLGLYISRQIVDLHNGQIFVETPVSGGNRFVVLLPLGFVKNTEMIGS